ncbi:Leucine-rich_repeat domain superfamily [Hexamita inflata]|uniref:Leucine-rich repeat domain superfamily n=1 Tax=Hexamita inflata TaxID=28002 RepID=A0AA86TRY3_9EUKA|nr:Leucine-rich repeat domain superfamily [Hexamita inflata]
MRQLHFLPNIKQILIDNNFIIDLEYLFPYYIQSIYYQRVPTDSDIQNYLTDICSDLSVIQFKELSTAKQSRSNELIHEYPAKYDSAMVFKYKCAQQYPANQFPNGPCGFGPQLVINNNQQIRDLKFIEQLEITDLRLENCKNAHLLRVPRTLKRFRCINSNLKTVKGLEQLVNLEQQYLHENEIVNIQSLKYLKKLNYAELRGNKINDFSSVELLRREGCLTNGFLIDNQREASQEEIIQARFW